MIARFDPAERDDVLTRARGLADVARLRVRRVVRPVDFVLLPPGDGGPTRFGTAELDALDPGTPADDGLALVAGRGLTGAPREVLVERGLATAWHLRPGDQVGIGNGRRRMRARVVGITLEPDVLGVPARVAPADLRPGVGGAGSSSGSAIGSRRSRSGPGTPTACRSCSCRRAASPTA